MTRDTLPPGPFCVDPKSPGRVFCDDAVGASIADCNLSTGLRLIAYDPVKVAAHITRALNTLDGYVVLRDKLLDAAKYAPIWYQDEIRTLVGNADDIATVTAPMTPMDEIRRALADYRELLEDPQHRPRFGHARLLELQAKLPPNDSDK